MEMFHLFTTVTLLLASFDISLCQRKVSRNVALGGEVKTVANFNCPEEFGYYPHPNDCTQYYVCVFGGALLESCTGGLMYSHELQTCDWPRNVGCDGAEISGPVAATSASPPSSRTREESRTRYTPPTPPPAQPAAIVTSRGQPRQLQHNQQEIIKQRQQQQLYADAEETLPPAEEVESDRQQRVYRGQPSTIGQVQKDRDGLRHSNAIPTYSGRSERIGVISFGTQQQQQQQQPQQQYSTIDDRLSNDLTLKRRRKRQTQRSRIRSIETSWRGGQQNFQTSRLNIGPYTLQPPPLQNPVFSSSYQKSNFVPSPLIDDEFKPFVPNYHIVPSHTVAKKVPFTSTSNDYFTAITTFRPVNPILREPNKLKHTIDYYRHENLMLPQHTHIINHNTSSIKITNPNINLSTASTTSTPMYSDSSKEEESNKATSDYPDFPEQFFGPPASYFNSKNKYESIENPFANPHFDFDKFLSGLREEPPTTTVSSPVNKLKSKPKTTTPPKTQPSDYYYEYEDDNEGRRESNDAPKKIYSSQIKPTLKTLPKPTNDYYYEEEYDYPQKNNNKPVNVSKNGEMKYSAKYQGKPLKAIKTTRVPQIATTSMRPTTKQFLTSETFASTSTVSSTTQKPKYTTRRKSKLTVPTTRSRSKPRQRLTDDDKKIRVDTSSTAPVQPSAISTATATARALYNSSQYNSNNYDPYYALYDDDVELYRDDDYSQQYNNNNNNAAQSQTPHYRRTPSPAIQSTQEEAPKRGNSGYIQNNYNNYQPNSNSDYNDDNSYNSQVEDQNAYRQVNRQPTRGDRNDLNYLEEASTKRTITTTTTRKTTTRTTTLRTFPPKKSTFARPVTAHENKTQAQSIINTLRDDPGPHPLTPHTIDPKHNSSLGLDETTTFRPHLPDTQSKQTAVVYKSAPFALTDEHLTTEKAIIFHYITKSSRSTTLVSTESPIKTSTAHSLKNKTFIVPTTYSPPKFFLKSLLPKSLTHSTTLPNLSDTKPQKTLKSVRKLISPINVNYGLSTVTGSSFESAEKLVPEVDSIGNSLPDRGTQSSEEKLSNEYVDEPTESKDTKLVTSSESLPASSEAITVAYDSSKADDYYLDDEIVNSHEESKLRHYVEPYDRFINVSSETKRFRTTIEIPPPHDLIDDSFKPKQEPDQSPDYKIQPYPKPIAQTTTRKTTTTSTVKTTTTDSPNTSVPARVSRVNTAIKSLIAVGGTQRQNVKCHESQNADSKCNDPKHQRTSTRGRGSTHYANGGNIVNNEVTVTVNRGTPASRPRPTLKPSTSIVSKASEFIDIYRYPPSRPAPIYPQPQPDKTAAKCRKDVCLLPDCSCGGKEIPGDLPVEQVPQLVLLTFDDSVNDLNKGLYSDLFEKGRTNPNGCPIAATFYVSHEWTDYSQVQNLYSDGHEIASHTVSHSFGEQFSQKKWTREVAGQREILSAYGGVHLEDVRGMRAPFLSVGGNKMFKMLYDSNFTYDSSMPIYENKPPSWPYTLDYKLFHDCMIPPCPTRSYPGVWEVPMVMWQDLNGGRCSMGDACSNPPDAEGVFKMLTKNFQRHYTTNRAPFGLFYHAAWFTQPHHKEGFINFLDSILEMKDVWLVTNWQAIQWVRDPTPASRLNSFQPFQCDFSNRPKRCNNPKVCNLWHKSGVRYMRTCQPCPDIYPWTGNTGIRSSRIDNDIED
ncbi:chitin deacetylase 5 isoform X3 [Tribolium castaneum]|uniref:chitin deacetylase 5 isoform X3 n=1 Tax=Tribolium castaneum TaxID=7070 RepID=UPI0030FEC930